MDARPELTVEQRHMLERVKEGSVYYGPLMPKDDAGRREMELLRELESAGYVRYCPYPEEYWVAIG